MGPYALGRNVDIMNGQKKIFKFVSRWSVASYGDFDIIISCTVRFTSPILPF